jgi:pimeloyl-ACP methyl ester carboxylesterase
VFVSIMLLPVIVCAQKAQALRVEQLSVPNGNIYVITQSSPKYTFDSARYAVFIPKDIGSIEGIFIHQHGCTMEGRGMSSAYDLQYQALAKKWKLAVIGPDLYDAKNNCHDWKDAESGTADALLKTIQNLAAVSGHKEITNAPWLLWGHSGGGYWAQSMMKTYPERIMAVFSYSPGLNAKFDYPVAAAKIPLMIRHAGPVGDACCWQTALNTFNDLRSRGAYAGIVLNAHQHHNFSYVRYLAVPFFESVLAQRNPSGETKGYKNMREVDDSKSWLGDTSTLNIYKAGNYPGDKLKAAWLPDSLMAIKWREYAITGTIIDRTPPPAPYEVKLMRRHNVTVSVTWKADADIESGISHFNIYKDNQLVGRFPSIGSYQQFDTNGDDAYPLIVPSMQTDVTLLWNDPAKISVSTVNHFGLESTRTTAP